jgi:hypothetical protein
MKEGQLWRVSVDTRKPARVAGIDADGGFALSVDRKQIVFVRQGQLMLSNVHDPIPVQLTRFAKPLRASTPLISRDNRHVSFAVSRSSTEFEPLAFNGTRIRSIRSVTAGRKLGIVAARGGEPLWISTLGDANAIEWTADGSLLFEEFSPDRKTRSIKTVSMDGSVAHHLERLRPGVVVPDARSGHRIERFVSIVDVDSGRSESIVSSRGVQIAPMFSPDGTRLLWRRSEEFFDRYLKAGAAPN